MAATAQAWVTVQPYELRIAISKKGEGKLDENVTSDFDIIDNNDEVVDPAQPTRRSLQIHHAVEEFRGAIRAGNRVPLSLTAETVPPEVKIHVLALVAFRITSAPLNLNAVLYTEKGAYSPLMTLYKDALAELKRIREGGTVSMPTDPEEDDADDAGLPTSGKVDENAEYSMETTG